MDAFPSVQLAASLYLLLFDWQHWRRRFWWVLTPCLMLWLSTMYLRFHYFVDLLAGMVVALIGWWMAENTRLQPATSRCWQPRSATGKPDPEAASFS
jgi:membrane-associated phospholipid phosphatase